MKTIQRYAVVAVVLGFVLGGCGGGAGQANDAQLQEAVSASAKEASPELEHDKAVSSFMNLLNQLEGVPQLAPLFDLYQLKAPIVMQDDEESSGLIALLRAVRITTSGGAVTITNRQTGGVIFTAPRSDLASGTFDAQNLPGGAPPPAGTCTAFTYSPWGVCQADGTQARTVTSSSPAGCTGGTPEPLTQPCTTTPPPPATCTGFTYSTWGACQPNGTQARTVLSSTPSGCTGGTPGPLTQTCQYTPPVTTCTGFTYSAWGACQPDGTQARTVTSSTPSGCTGGTPGPLTQTCTPPIDGAALYGQKCASCHGALASSNLAGKNITVQMIKDFRMTQGLTDAQLQAIVTAVGP